MIALLINILRWISILIILTSLLGVASYFGWNAIRGLFLGEVLVIPDFRGKTLTYVLENKPSGIELELLKKQESSRVKPNTVIDQNPAPGSEVKAGRKLFLVISEGSNLKEVISVIGTDLRMAGLRLRRQGFSVGNIAYREAGEASQGKVLAQSPEEGTMAAEGLEINLLAGAFSALNERVPNLRGLSLAEARSRVTSEGWILAPSFDRRDQSKAPGRILDQEPLPGLKILENKKEIHVWVNPSDEKDEVGSVLRVENVEIRIPPGLQKKDLMVDLVDSRGTQRLHQQVYEPGSIFFLKVEYEGNGYLNLFLDGLFYRQLELGGENNGPYSR